MDRPKNLSFLLSFSLLYPKARLTDFDLCLSSKVFSGTIQPNALCYLQAWRTAMYDCRIYKLAVEPYIKSLPLKSLNSEVNVFHNFDVGKVSRIHETYVMDQQLFCWRHFSNIEVVQNTDLNFSTLASFFLTPSSSCLILINIHCQ